MMKSLVQIKSMSHGGKPTFSKVHGFLHAWCCGLVEPVWYIDVMKRVWQW